nr:hypothetical protein [Rubidibacter lacunae]
MQIPRDRRSEFTPVLVPKGQRCLAGIDEKILALSARGSSTQTFRHNCATSMVWTSPRAGQSGHLYRAGRAAPVTLSPASGNLPNCLARCPAGESPPTRTSGCSRCRFIWGWG